jgi:hypothetical protein
MPIFIIKHTDHRELDDEELGYSTAASEKTVLLWSLHHDSSVRPVIAARFSAKCKLSVSESAL